MVSHEIPDVFFISDRILILYDGQIIFQGAYDELDQLKHPMVDEFVKSLEGFQDELTGLHSKKNFMTLYEKDVKQKEPHETITVVIFTLDDLDGLSENVGHTQAQEVIQSLGEYVNKHFGDMGISTRLGRDQIATILPQADRNGAERMLNDFVRGLQEQGLGNIRPEAQAESPSADGYTFSISVGVAEGKASEDIEITSERARSEQKTVARFRC